eukprot:2072522-Prymnesium_polylepis.1
MLPEAAKDAAEAPAVARPRTRAPPSSRAYKLVNSPSKQRSGRPKFCPTGIRGRRWLDIDLVAPERVLPAAPPKKPPPSASFARAPPPAS